MNKKNRKYSREFKLEAVHLCEADDRPLSEVAWQIGIHPKKLSKWRAKFGAMIERSSLDKGFSSDNDEELRRLRQENIRLREERDTLIKVLAFSSAAIKSEFDVESR